MHTGVGTSPSSYTVHVTFGGLIWADDESAVQTCGVGNNVLTWLDCYADCFAQLIQQLIFMRS